MEGCGIGMEDCGSVKPAVPGLIFLASHFSFFSFFDLDLLFFSSLRLGLSQVCIVRFDRSLNKGSS